MQIKTKLQWAKIDSGWEVCGVPVLPGANEDGEMNWWLAEAVGTVE